jgi:guanylate kinase
MSKKIILVGPTCSGKNYIRQKFYEKGYDCDVSYTTRDPRKGEINGVDYIFISKSSFEEAILVGEFYEWVRYGDHYYGTGLSEWEDSEIFIMETDGVNNIDKKDRKHCLVIYINTPLEIRYKRMKLRGWNEEKINERIEIDKKKFKNFTNYDLEISSQTNEEFNF